MVCLVLLAVVCTCLLVVLIKKRHGILRSKKTREHVTSDGNELEYAGTLEYDYVNYSTNTGNQVEFQQNIAYGTVPNLSKEHNIRFNETGVDIQHNLAYGSVPTVSSENEYELDGQLYLTVIN